MVETTVVTGPVPASGEEREEIPINDAPVANNAIIHKPQNSPVKAVAAMMDDEDSGAGFEDVQASDLVLPFVKILQSGSPEVKRTEPEYIKGAQEGMILDTVSKRLYKKLIVVPCKMVTHYIEWKPRTDKGGGLVKNHGTDRSVLDNTIRNEKTGRDVLPNGNEVIATATWFVLLIGGDEVNPAVNDDPGTYTDLMSQGVLTLSATAMKASRQWVAQASALRLRRPDGSLYQPAMFAMSYELGLAGTRNDQGSWYLPTIKQGGWIKDYKNGVEIRKEAKAYHTLANELHTTLVNAQRDEAPQQSSGDGGNYRRQESQAGDARSRAESDEEIPF